ncbi:MAG: hypothetical protein RIC07_26000 [Coleofasciculus sp. E1-EBD-02]
MPRHYCDRTQPPYPILLAGLSNLGLLHKAETLSYQGLEAY